MAYTLLSGLLLLHGAQPPADEKKPAPQVQPHWGVLDPDAYKAPIGIWFAQGVHPSIVLGLSALSRVLDVLAVPCSPAMLDVLVENLAVLLKTAVLDALEALDSTTLDNFVEPV